MIKNISKYIKQGHRLPLIVVLCLFAVYVSAHTYMKSNINHTVMQLPKGQNIEADTTKKKPKAGIKKIIYSAEVQRKVQNKPYDILVGGVEFEHEGAFLYCDSAHFNQITNEFDAYKDVRMVQGDTIFLFGDYMHYDGNTQLVTVRHKVMMENRPQKVKLYTDSLDYDRAQNIGYYFDGGKLVDEVNELTSIWGQYNPDVKQATFYDDVVLINAKFKLYSDTLLYNTGNNIATIVSKTKIVSDSGIINTTRGWHNTQTQQSVLLDQSTVASNFGDKLLTGDTIFYNKESGYGEVFGNMHLIDTVKKVILKGNYGFYNELTDYAMATDSAYAIDYSQGDSLFIHGDTLKLITIPREVLRIRTDSSERVVDVVLNPKKELAKADLKVKDIEITTNIDSVLIKTDSTGVEYSIQDSLVIDKTDQIELEAETVEIPQMPGLPEKENAVPELRADTIRETIFDKQIKAYYGVRFYRSDMQGICDSMQFSSRDSILHLYRDPVLWNDKNQISGDTIDIFFNDSTINYIHVKKYSFSIEQKEDTTLFNQMKGRSLKAFFEHGSIRHILIEGNAESIFYPEEKDKSVIGLNYLQSSFLEIWIKDGEFQRLKTWPKSTGKMTPLFMVQPEQKRLPEFFWYDYLRPLNRYDIFRKTKKRSTDIPRRRSAIFDQED